MAVTVGNRTVLSTLDEIVDPAHTAVLIIDLQNDFAGDGGVVSKRRPADVALLREPLPEILKFLDASRAAGVLHVYVGVAALPNGASESDANLARLVGQWDGQIPNWAVEGTWGSEFIPELPGPGAGDIVIHKRRASAFAGTDLDLVLRAHHVKTLIVIGVTTSGCVMYTARDAMMEGYYVVVPIDCLGSQSRDWHDATILIMRRLFNYVGPWGALAESWSKRDRRSA
jgi:nicotinamidase-related amidase